MYRKSPIFFGKSAEIILNILTKCRFFPILIIDKPNGGKIMSYTDELEAYNEALREAEKEEMLKAKGRYTNLATMKVSKSFSLSLIMETFGKEERQEALLHRVSRAV